MSEPPREELVRLDFRPRSWQRECHAQRKRFTVLALHRRAGKTELAIMELLDAAMRCSKELGHFVYLAPFLKQAKANVWARLKLKLEPMRRRGSACVVINEGELSVRFPNGASVRIYGADNPDAMRGMRLDGVVLDEVAWMAPEVWTDVIQPALADRRGWALFIGTPAGINLFSELFYGAANKPDWHAARYTVHDTDALDPEEVRRISDPTVTPERTFAREFLCDFAAAGDDQLISLTDVETAARRVYVARDIQGAPRILGIDPARFGDDRSVVVRRQGLQMFDPIIFRQLDNMELAARIANIMEDWCPHAVFIDSGAGAGVIDRLRQLGHEVVEVPFGGKATASALFINRRTEMWWLMRDWLASGAIPNDVTLKQELATPIYWFDNSGRKVLEAKDEIKKRLLGAGSPDIADALALTFAHPVHVPDEYEEFSLRKERSGSNKAKEYNMFGDL